MEIARKMLAGLAWLFVLGVALQFLFAGMGALGGEDWEMHKGFGWSALHLFPILIVIAAFVGKAGQQVLILSMALFAVSLVQPFWVTEFRGEFLGAMHVLGALIIFALAHSVAQRSTLLVRT